MKKDRIAICVNCGVIQHEQLDGICTTCNRAELKNLTELRKDLVRMENILAATQVEVDGADKGISNLKRELEIGRTITNQKK
jgi:hypothetical protein